MKTSNKILIGTALSLILGLFLYSYLLRKEYQRAMANPIARIVKVDLKEAKFLNINHHYNVNFRPGKTFQIQLQSLYKNALKYNYVGDSLNVDAKNTGEITIFTPTLPILKMNCDKGYNLQVYISKLFKASNIDATFAKTCLFIVDENTFENVNIKSKEALKVNISTCKIKNLKVNLPSHSELFILYSNINKKDLILADSCSVTITGNYKTGVTIGKYYGTTL